MSQLLNFLKSAERKRHDSVEPHSGSTDSAGGTPGGVLSTVPSRAPGVNEDTASEDEWYWAEVKRRLVALEQQNAVHDTFLTDEGCALSREAKALLARIEATELEAVAALENSSRIAREATALAQEREAAEAALAEAADRRAQAEREQEAAARARTQAAKLATEQAR